MNVWFNSHINTHSPTRSLTRLHNTLISIHLVCACHAYTHLFVYKHISLHSLICSFTPMPLVGFLSHKWLCVCLPRSSHTNEYTVSKFSDHVTNTIFVHYIRTMWVCCIRLESEISCCLFAHRFVRLKLLYVMLFVFIEHLHHVVMFNILNRTPLDQLFFRMRCFKI